LPAALGSAMESDDAFPQDDSCNKESFSNIWSHILHIFNIEHGNFVSGLYPSSSVQKNKSDKNTLVLIHGSFFW
jgi:hypothetical protein